MIKKWYQKINVFFSSPPRWLKLTLAAAMLVFLFWSRFYLLDVIPATLPHDESIYSIQAKSYALQGRTLDQSQSFLTLKPFDSMYAELPATVMSIGFLFTDNPLLASHLVSAVMGVTLPFIFSWLLYGLWKNKSIAIAGFVLVTFNPLLWQFSRLAYDAFYSLWFYALAGAFFVQGKRKLVSIAAPIFFIGFFQYQGFKLLLFPWIAFLTALKVVEQNKVTDIMQVFYNLKKYLQKYFLELAVVVSALALTLFYGLVLLPTQNASNRLNDIIFNDTAEITQTVNQERRLSIVNPFMNISTNKVQGIMYFMLHRLLGAFNPFMLFMIIEPGVSAFSVWVHGIFYWIEGFWMALGALIMALNKKRRLTVVVLALSVVGLSFPTLINSGSNWHLLRTMLSYFTLLFFAVWGLKISVQNNWLKWIVIPLYIVSILNFSYLYFFRYPVISLDWGNFHERLVARYVSLTQELYPDKQISVHTSFSDFMFWSYLLYSDTFTKESADQIAQEVIRNKDAQQKRYQLGNLVFTDACFDPTRDEVIITEVNFKRCGEEDHRENNKEESSSAPALVAASTSANLALGANRSLLAVMDSGAKFVITHDRLCEAQKLSQFVYPSTYDDLRLEKMSQTEFCKVWVSDQNLVGL